MDRGPLDEQGETTPTIMTMMTRRLAGVMPAKREYNVPY
jgi:hypothetical protein